MENTLVFAEVSRKLAFHSLASACPEANNTYYLRHPTQAPVMTACWKQITKESYFNVNPCWRLHTVIDTPLGLYSHIYNNGEENDKLNHISEKHTSRPSISHLFPITAIGGGFFFVAFLVCQTCSHVHQPATCEQNKITEQHHNETQSYW